MHLSENCWPKETRSHDLSLRQLGGFLCLRSEKPTSVLENSFVQVNYEQSFREILWETIPGDQVCYLLCWSFEHHVCRQSADEKCITVEVTQQARRWQQLGTLMSLPSVKFSAQKRLMSTLSTCGGRKQVSFVLILVYQQANMSWCGGSEEITEGGIQGQHLSCMLTASPWGHHILYLICLLLKKEKLLKVFHKKTFCCILDHSERTESVRWCWTTSWWQIQKDEVWSSWC